MSKSKPLIMISKLLVEKYGALGLKAAERLSQWYSGEVLYAYPEIIEKHLEEKYIDLLFDAFWQVLPFGTGGRRGKVGYGPNRLNAATIAMTIQGHCNYLRKAFPKERNLAVVVANDVRVFKDISGVYEFLGKNHPLLGVSSRSLGKLACEIYAGNGVVAFFAEPKNEKAILSTPELSFLISNLKEKCFKVIGGINLSASHNPPDDNGVKVYDEFGSQPIAPNDQLLADVVEQVTEIHSLPFDKALAQGLIRGIPVELHLEYIETYVKIYNNIYKPEMDVPIIYTPLCGCGLTTVGDVLKHLGFPFLVPPDQGPDGSFSVIPFKAPNPEVPQATKPAMLFADSKGAGVVLSSDPDADRVGLEIKLNDGSWYHFDGNQIAAILCYFLMLDPKGPRRKGLVIETLVTTKILSKIVEKAGDSYLIDDLLVGFKYIADVLKTLEHRGYYRNITCSPHQLVLAAEESHGVIVVPTIRDKDATPACMYLAALYQMLHQEGKTLLDYYISILEELGGYDCVNRSIMMTGAGGILKKDCIMSTLRQNPPKTFGGQAVRNMVDYWDEEIFGTFLSETDRLPRNVIQILTDAFIITIRPSGTEPKLKFYCQLIPFGKPSTAKGIELLREVRSKADMTARTIYNELLGLIDLSLNETALLLPDIVDIDRKLYFDRHTIPELHKGIITGNFTDLKGILDWLQGESAAMTPGADSLPALKAPIAYLCDRWAKEPILDPLFDELESWAKH